MSITYCIRNGSVLGVKHAKLGVNNQDAVMALEFGIPAWEKSYRMGFVSDGCTGIPAFSASEVGSNLLVVYCLARTQELIANGAQMEEIPLPLYHSVTNFLHTLANMVVPASIYWPYPMEFKGAHAFRNQLKAPKRFMTDYLAATILGFVDDGETLVTFQAGDGVLIVNDEVTVIDQNDRPDYPAMSVNSPGGGFQVNTYASADVQRLGLATDGIEELLAVSDLGLLDQLFAEAQAGPMGLQFLLNRLRKSHGHLMADDCTVLTLERKEEADAPEDSELS